MSVLDGVKVVELGIWVAGPGIAGVFAEWGAEVIKVESPSGDPLRHVYSVFAGADRADSPAFDLDNRGKKSVVLDLQSSEGRKSMERLLDSADVFVTNLRPDALQRLGLAHDEVLSRHPRVIYGSVSGYGLHKKVADLAAYDLGVFWGRSGLAASAQDRGASPPTTGGGFGDHVTALAGIGGILAALFRRTQTGLGQLVEISLLRTGVYCAGWDINSYLRHGRAPGQTDRTSPANPLWNSYIARDDRWFYLLGLEGDRHWPKLVAAIDRPELMQDERYLDARQRRRNSSALTATLDETFALEDLRYWMERFEEHKVWWAPVNTIAETTEDEAIVDSGAFGDVPAGGGAPAHRAVMSPVRFGRDAVSLRTGVPGLGEHSDEVLNSLE